MVVDATGPKIYVLKIRSDSQEIVEPYMVFQNSIVVAFTLWRKTDRSETFGTPCMCLVVTTGQGNNLI